MRDLQLHVATNILATIQMSRVLGTTCSFLNLLIEINCCCHVKEHLKNGHLTNLELVQLNKLMEFVKIRNFVW